MPYGLASRLAYRNSYPRDIDLSTQSAGSEVERPAVALSPQTGSGAIQIAEGLADYFRARTPAAEPPWRVFAKDLMAKVLEDHRLPTGLATILPEDASNPVDDVLYEFLGLHPPSWVIAQHSIETIVRLVRAGNVILVGWGVNAITRNLPNVFHVRLVGSVERRIARVQAREKLSYKEALAFIERSDRGRQRYVKRHFHQQVSDVLLYDLTVNTDQFDAAHVVRLIGDVVLARRRSTTAMRALSANATVT